MEKTVRLAEGSMLYRKIDELRLSAADRSEAVAALQAADKLADGIYWIFSGLARIASWLTPATTLKHQ